jgi:cysteinyl-tRNA synthetase
LYDFIRSNTVIARSEATKQSRIHAQITKEYEKQFQQALENNLDTPKALAIIWEMIKSKEISYKNKKTALLKFDKVLGLDLDKIKKEEIEISDEVKELIEQREEARKNKDWKKADELRDEIKKRGLVVEDKPIK